MRYKDDFKFFNTGGSKNWCVDWYLAFLQIPSAEITAASLFRYVSTSFVHLETEFYAGFYYDIVQLACIESICEHQVSGFGADF